MTEEEKQKLRENILIFVSETLEDIYVTEDMELEELPSDLQTIADELISLQTITLRTL